MGAEEDRQGRTHRAAQHLVTGPDKADVPCDDTSSPAQGAIGGDRGTSPPEALLTLDTSSVGMAVPWWAPPHRTLSHTGACLTSYRGCPISHEGVPS